VITDILDGASGGPRRWEHDGVRADYADRFKGDGGFLRRAGTIRGTANSDVVVITAGISAEAGNEPR